MRKDVNIRKENLVAGTKIDVFDTIEFVRNNNTGVRVSILIEHDSLS